MSKRFIDTYNTLYISLVETIDAKAKALKLYFEDTEEKDAAVSKYFSKIADGLCTNIEQMFCDGKLRTDGTTNENKNEPLRSKNDHFCFDDRFLMPYPKEYVKIIAIRKKRQSPDGQRNQNSLVGKTFKVLSSTVRIKGWGLGETIAELKIENPNVVPTNYTPYKIITSDVYLWEVYSDPDTPYGELPSLTEHK